MALLVMILLRHNHPDTVQRDRQVTVRSGEPALDPGATVSGGMAVAPQPLK